MLLILGHCGLIACVDNQVFREAAKKFLLMAGPLRPNPPPPSNLKWLLKFWKKVPKKVILSLMVRPLTLPPPLLMARPLREELFLRLPLGMPENIEKSTLQSVRISKHLDLLAPACLESPGRPETTCKASTTHQVD